MSHSQFHSIETFILRHAWLNLWDKHMTTGRINQVTPCLGVRFWGKRHGPHMPSPLNRTDKPSWPLCLGRDGIAQTNTLLGSSSCLWFFWIALSPLQLSGTVSNASTVKSNWYILFLWLVSLVGLHLTIKCTNVFPHGLGIIDTTSLTNSAWSISHCVECTSKLTCHLC